ncbi:hypothetical protein [Hydrogenobacter thermophilus]|uniref:hypothetical protein n=1 Tax=Hydrogenobacter thermophilus TaxID=940 RepID=UPI0006628129|nr:hypothetical protein [Hydrogenobacter thermophilus]
MQLNIITVLLAGGLYKGTLTQLYAKRNFLTKMATYKPVNKVMKIRTFLMGYSPVGWLKIEQKQKKRNIWRGRIF